MGCGDLTIPELAFMGFQLAFAVITLAILTSAMAERVKISGAVAGLVAITSAAGFVGPMSALVIGAVAAIAYAFTLTLILAKLVDATIGLRVTEEEEYVGLDISQHGEEAYA